MSISTAPGKALMLLMMSLIATTLEASLGSHFSVASALIGSNGDLSNGR